MLHDTIHNICAWHQWSALYIWYPRWRVFMTGVHKTIYTQYLYICIPGSFMQRQYMMMPKVSMIYFFMSHIHDTHSLWWCPWYVMFTSGIYDTNFLDLVSMMHIYVCINDTQSLVSLLNNICVWHQWYTILNFMLGIYDTQCFRTGIHDAQYLRLVSMIHSIYVLYSRHTIFMTGIHMTKNIHARIKSVISCIVDPIP